MAKDFAFQFCPGDYLRDTQCLSEKSQVAYDRIMCEHIRNVSNDAESIWIPHDKVCFFAKRLNEDESAELFHVLKKNPIKDGGFQIEWVAEKVAERQSCSAQRLLRRFPCGLPVEMPFEFFEGSPAAEVVAEHFVSPLVWFCAGPKRHKHRRDDRTIDLQCHPRGVLAQKMPTTQHAFEPAKK